MLLPVGGVGGGTIIDHTLDAFAKCDITELVIVVGYAGEGVMRWVGDGSRFGMRVEYVHNPDFRSGNAVSLYAARSLVKDETFILSMADHMVSPGLLRRIVEFAESGNVLGVDFNPSPREVEEGTRVMVKSGVVQNIGKGLNDWNGIDAGVFRLTSDVFEAIEDILAANKMTEYQLSEAIQRMLDTDHKLFACDISDFFWQDVDTWDDLDLVRSAVAG